MNDEQMASLVPPEKDRMAFRVQYFRPGGMVRDGTAMVFTPLKIEDLALGMYVKLDCSWWKHPFASNKFKVTSRKDLEIINKISKLKLFFDPDLSDTLPPSEEEDISSNPIATEIQAEPTPEVIVVAEGETEEVSSILPGDRKERSKDFQERRNRIKRSEQAYKEPTKQTKIALKDLSTGNPKGVTNYRRNIDGFDQIPEIRTIAYGSSRSDEWLGNGWPSLFSCHECLCALPLGRKRIGVRRRRTDALRVRRPVS